MNQLSSVVDVTLVTHRGPPEGAPDDVILADKLRELGLTVNAIPWDEPTYDWRSSRVSLVHSTWDYHAHRRAWKEWIEASVPCIPTVDVSENWPELHALVTAAVNPPLFAAVFAEISAVILRTRNNYRSGFFHVLCTSSIHSAANSL